MLFLIIVFGLLLNYFPQPLFGFLLTALVSAIFVGIIKPLKLKIYSDKSKFKYNWTGFFGSKKIVEIPQSNEPVLAYKKVGLFVGPRIILWKEELFEANLEYYVAGKKESIPFLDPSLRYLLRGSLSIPFIKSILFTKEEIHKISNFLDIAEKEVN